MKTANIDFVMEMTKAYLDGKIDYVNYTLDFPYEINNRYKRMAKENRQYAELIYECLVKEGIDQSSLLNDAQFKRLIQKQYKYIIDVAKEGFL